MLAAFTAATIQLYGRLWLELEALAGKAGAADARTQADVLLRLQILRLELLVLLDACNSSRWRDLLRPLHRENLKMTVENLLATLNSAPDSLRPDVLCEAQNDLFEAVLNEYESNFTAPSIQRRSGNLLVEEFA